MPPLADFLITRFGWRIAFATLGSLVLLIVVTVTLALVRSKPEDMGLLPDGEARVSEGSTGDSIHETREAAGSDGLSLAESLRTSAFWILSLGHVLWSFGSMSIIGHLPAFLTDQGFEKMAAGALSLAIGCSIVGRLSFGTLADRFGKKAAHESGLDPPRPGGALPLPGSLVRGATRLRDPVRPGTGRRRSAGSTADRRVLRDSAPSARSSASSRFLRRWEPRQARC